MEAHRFLLNLDVGDGYMTSTTTKVICTSRTNKTIRFNNGDIIRLKKLPNDLFYLSSKSIVRKNKSYDRIGQILRDVEGYLTYRIHSKTKI
jgi:hypothetical protein